MPNNLPTPQDPNPPKELPDPSREAPHLQYLSLGFEQTLKSLKNESVLIKGGVTAYAIFTVAVLVAFYLFLRAFVDLTDIAAQIAQTFLAILAVGLAFGFFAEYLKYRKEDALARYQLEAVRLRVQVASERSDEFIRLLEAWIRANPDSFAVYAVKQSDPLGQFVGSLDKIYSSVGLMDFVPDLPAPKF